MEPTRIHPPIRRPTLKARLILILLLLFGALFFAGQLSALPAALPDGEALAIIVNKSNPIDNVSLTDLRKLFKAEQTRWSNGQRVTVVMRQAGQDERATVLRVIYHMSEWDFNRYFLRGTFTGETQSVPKTLATAGGVDKFIFNVPGAIGYVRASEVDDSVKVVRVDGHALRDVGYPLKMQK
jgi:ABC-type phosphate transport system substrate-binding protein